MSDTGLAQQPVHGVTDDRPPFPRDGRCPAHGGEDLPAVMMRLSRQLTLTRHRLFSGAPEALPLQLMFLMHKMGPRRSGEYAAALSADPSTVSRQVAHLVRVGLARREADQQDGRATHVVLTDEGRQALDRLRSVVDEVFAGVVADWSEQDQLEFVRLTHRYVTAFDERGQALVDRIASEISGLTATTRGDTAADGPAAPPDPPPAPPAAHDDPTHLPTDTDDRR